MDCARAHLASLVKPGEFVRYRWRYCVVSLSAAPSHGRDRERYPELHACISTGSRKLRNGAFHDRFGRWISYPTHEYIYILGLVQIQGFHCFDHCLRCIWRCCRSITNTCSGPLLPIQAQQGSINTVQTSITRVPTNQTKSSHNASPKPTNVTSFAKAQEPKSKARTECNIASCMQ